MSRNSMRSVGRTWSFGSAIFIVSCCGVVDPVAASDFFSGKQMQIVVSTEAGTTYDIYARKLAEHMSKYIPGKPKIIVQNMPGAAGLKVANYIYNVAPKDGTVIGATHGSVPTAALLSQDGAQYESAKLSWLGSITKEPFVGYIWHTAPAKKWADLYTTEVTMGTQAVGSASADYAILANALLGTKVKNVFGYKSAPEVRLAIERGEIMGGFGTAYSALRSQAGDWLRDKKISIFIQHSLTKHPDFPDVPLFVDQARNDDDRRLLEVILSRQETGKPYFLPPGIPADRLSILRKAFDDTMKDSAFVDVLQKASLEVSDPMTGQEMEAMVGRLMSTPKATVDRIGKIFEDFKNAPN